MLERTPMQIVRSALKIKRIVMPKIMQNLVVLMESSQATSADVSIKCGNMCLNRFCIDEDAAFELSGVYSIRLDNLKFPTERKTKGTRYQLTSFTINFTCDF